MFPQWTHFCTLALVNGSCSTRQVISAPPHLGCVEFKSLFLPYSCCVTHWALSCSEQLQSKVVGSPPRLVGGGCAPKITVTPLAAPIPLSRSPRGTSGTGPHLHSGLPGRTTESESQLDHVGNTWIRWDQADVSAGVGEKSSSRGGNRCQPTFSKLGRWEGLGFPLLGQRPGALGRGHQKSALKFPVLLTTPLTGRWEIEG